MLVGAIVDVHISLKKIQTKSTKVVETTYIIDSIKTERKDIIFKIDSLYEIKTKYIEKVNNVPDDSVYELFKQLIWE
jgi:hypothetical protein